MDEEKIMTGQISAPGAANGESLPESPEEGKISPENNRGGENAGEGKKPPLGFLELVYGVLFEPLVTFQKTGQQLPFSQTVLIFTLVNVIIFLFIGLLTPRLIYSPVAGQPAAFLRFSAPVVALTGLFFQFGKWFAYSGLLHLLAEFFGGQGRALGVWVVAGLASLPAIFLVPVDLLLYLFGIRGFALSFLVPLFNFLVVVWGAVLLVFGIRQEHALSTGRAVAVVLLPPAAVLVGGVIFMLVFMTLTASFFPFGQVPGLIP